MGPTAVGKTGLALEIAGNGFEIVSADSVQVYRYMDVGSGKPSKDELASVPHHLIDIVDPDYDFSVGDFCRLAFRSSMDILSKDRLPLFVGGTGLYIDSFFKGISDIPEVAEEVREELKKDLTDRGIAVLYDELQKHDPGFASRIHTRDVQRILRGLEVWRGTGKAISEYYSTSKGHGSEDTLYIGLNIERSALYDRINQRVDVMIKSGLVDEVHHLLEMGYNRGLKSLKSIGYEELLCYFEKRISLNDAIAEIKKNTRHYAKRQLTWFRRNKNIIWFNPADKGMITECIEEWMYNINSKSKE
ncbi:MAG TPA: tRNA (adenosine(37)-N6)-dimethylallyltransferase MiaA [Spirochaetota bacterium]|nr:tRNA (adenosine(37)-N6)-dimethylallyltransferase MiaA [Spirochaetota bacterium]